MNRTDITAIIADIDDTMLRVRDLTASSSRAAALQCLDDARRHLTIAMTHAARPSSPPSLNEQVREGANAAFRESRRILGEVLK